MTVKRLYETMYILRPDLPDQEADAAIAKYQDFLVQQESEDITIQHRGRRRLAYDISYMTIKLEPEAVEAEDAEAIIPDAEEPVTTADVAVADVAVTSAE
jgi:small subunit ribosomal protein S6